MESTLQPPDPSLPPGPAPRACPRQRHAARRWLTLCLCLQIAIAPSGCRTAERVFQPVRAENMRDAGSVHLAVLAVAPWSDYVQALRPNFELTADQALAKVARDGRWHNQENQSAQGAGAESVLLDQPSATGRQPAKPMPGMQVPQAYLEGPYVRLGPGGAQPGADSESGPDAMLKYSAAAALYQEVQLLNRYISDAAIPAGFRPYMVRLQVSLMPSRRHAPYDAYTTLSFFIPGEHGNDEGSEPPSQSPKHTTDDGIFDGPFGNGPKVLPLLVTDNLEASLESRSFENIRTLLLSLLDYPGNSFIEPMFSGMLHGAVRDQVFGRDLNSLLTVARLSENTLRIRLGATQEATANYAMVPRNHNITLLLMVPEGAPPLMEVVSKTVLVDTENGDELVASDARAQGEVLEAFRKAQHLEDLETATLEAMHALARQNDQEGFAALLHASLGAERLAGLNERSLWIELVSLVIGDQYASSLFELPGQGQNVEESSQVFRNQTLVVEDDGNRASVVLREARFPEFEQILAVLSVEGSDPAIVLPAELVELDLTRRELRVAFPSLVRWNLIVDRSLSVNLLLKLSWAGKEQSFSARHVEIAAR